MKRVDFGLATRYDSGIRTSVAVTAEGRVVEVHESEGPRTIWYHVGTLRDGVVSWGPSRKYDNGQRPAVAASGTTVVEVHESEGNSGLWYHVGRIEGDTVRWGGSHKYDSGANPRVAMNRHGVVVEVHKSEWNAGLWYHVGRVSGDTIKWGPSRKYDTGITPSVSINDDGVVVEVHQSEGNDGLWYHVGRVSGDSISWGPSRKYDTGTTPSVALNNDGTVVEVHRSQWNDGLWSHTGTVQGDQVAWGPSVNFDTGEAPAVAVAGDLAVQTHGSLTSLWYSAALVIDRARWMESSPGLMQKQLWQVTLPGTHDSGAYDLSTDRVPETCRDAPGWIAGALIRPYAVAQAENILGQLNGGVRYFDLRPAFVDGDFHTYHDCIGPLVSGQLTQLRSYLQSVSKELVIVNVSHFCQFGDAEHAKLVKMIQDSVGQWLYKGTAANPLTVTLGEYVANRPCVLLVYQSDYVSRNPTPGFRRSLSVFDEYTNTTDFEKMRADQLAKLQAHPGSPQQLFLLSWTLTFRDWTDIFKGGSLHSISEKANRQLGDFVAQYGRQYKINVLYVDFFQDARATDLAVWLNRPAGTAARLDAEAESTIEIPSNINLSDAATPA